MSEDLKNIEKEIKKQKKERETFIELLRETNREIVNVLDEDKKKLHKDEDKRIRIKLNEIKDKLFKLEEERAQIVSQNLRNSSKKSNMPVQHTPIRPATLIIPQASGGNMGDSSQTVTSTAAVRIILHRIQY